jgi:hypothetical protein
MIEAERNASKWRATGKDETGGKEVGDIFVSTAALVNGALRGGLRCPFRGDREGRPQPAGDDIAGGQEMPEEFIRDPIFGSLPMWSW